MLIIDHKMILDLKVDAINYFNWVSEAIIQKNKATLPAKLSLKIENDGFLNIMPSLLKNRNLSGVKTVSRYSDRNPTLDSDILLYDFDKGTLKALIDGNIITAMRTGAVAIHALKTLAKKNFESIALIGLGIQAKATIKVFASVFPNRKVKIKLYAYKDQHFQFSNFIKSLPHSDNYEIEYHPTYESLIKDSDVIISAVTYFENDICESHFFKKGCLLIPIHTRGFMNCDIDFDKVFVDDVNHIKGFKNFEFFKPKMNEVSAVINNNCEGRSSDDERIIVYNIGIAIHDLYIANEIYKLCLNLPEVKYFKPLNNDWL